MRRGLHVMVAGVLLAAGAVQVKAADTDAAKARPAQEHRTPSAKELRKEIASPVRGDFTVANPYANRSQWQTEVGGYNGNGFVTPSGQPASTPSNPTSFQ